MPKTNDQFFDILKNRRLRICGDGEILEDRSEKLDKSHEYWYKEIDKVRDKIVSIIDSKCDKLKKTGGEVYTHLLHEEASKSMYTKFSYQFREEKDLKKREEAFQKAQDEWKKVEASAREIYNKKIIGDFKSALEKDM